MKTAGMQKGAHVWLNEWETQTHNKKNAAASLLLFMLSAGLRLISQLISFQWSQWECCNTWVQLWHQRGELLLDSADDIVCACVCVCICVWICMHFTEDRPGEIGIIVALAMLILGTFQWAIITSINVDGLVSSWMLLEHCLFSETYIWLRF